MNGSEDDNVTSDGGVRASIQSDQGVDTLGLTLFDLVQYFMLSRK